MSNLLIIVVVFLWLLKVYIYAVPGGELPVFILHNIVAIEIVSFLTGLLSYSLTRLKADKFRNIWIYRMTLILSLGLILVPAVVAAFVIYKAVATS